MTRLNEFTDKTLALPQRWLMGKIHFGNFQFYKESCDFIVLGKGNSSHM